MKLRALGCSGGIGGDRRTTSFLPHRDVLIDAGTAAGDLTRAELASSDRVLLTRSDLEHVAAVPLWVDAAGGMRQAPRVLHATDETIRILKEHRVNRKRWPDFTQLPDPVKPTLRYETMSMGSPVDPPGRSLIPCRQIAPYRQPGIRSTRVERASCLRTMLRPTWRRGRRTAQRAQGRRFSDSDERFESIEVRVP